MAGHPGQRQHGRDSLPALAGPQARDTQRNPDVLRRGQHRHQPEGLEDERHLFAPQRQPLPLGHPVHLAAVHPHPPRRRVVQAADDVQQRGLAGAGSPAQGNELTAVYRERDPAQGMNGRMSAAEGPANTVRRHHGLRRPVDVIRAARRMCLAGVHSDPSRGGYTRLASNLSGGPCPCTANRQQRREHFGCIATNVAYPYISRVCHRGTRVGRIEQVTAREADAPRLKAAQRTCRRAAAPSPFHGCLTVLRLAPPDHIRICFRSRRESDSVPFAGRPPTTRARARYGRFCDRRE
jgi:hypothetical protein